MRISFAWTLGLSLLCLNVVAAAPPAELTITGDWSVKVIVPAHDGQPEKSAEIQIDPPQIVTVTAEKYTNLPVFNPAAPGYARGAHLKGVEAQEVTTPHLLDPESLVVRTGQKDTDELLVRGKDYESDLSWGNLGRLEGGKIDPKQPVYASYKHNQLRLDTIVLTPAGDIKYRPGQPAAGSPQAPELASGERRLANIWLPGKVAKLTDDNLFPILETKYPAPPASTPSIAEQRIPKTMAKLRSGEPVKILAWGDSVTDGRYLPEYAQNRWQARFVDQLKERFPQAKIELVTEAWGGRNTATYLAVPPGEPHNYAETVLAVKPDLIVSEFVNDAGLKPADVETRYSKFLADFQGMGSEWIILTPHYVRPDWMGLTKEKGIDQDPRPYVTGLREFSEKHNVALADASLRYGRLWRQGLPYSTLMSNSINHPDPTGMLIFVDALMELFPER
ncbi:SGNH/GDSL hydrolase family protein [Planctomicrobium piriforme]|uniref:Lysophospholipase L1 n=1 Tax=Planctomicrobium piriforme TaxID=1576369 RepID=A0A1I3RPN5_9PLAN|nr:SGNH/GDSL hydrolase family protein [Planctomicrobium piriforme]SFJ47217.1 Lysophospholipase L1 [Planctomicrobium piriforme]